MNKRDAFHFSSVHRPHLDCNSPSNIYYASISSKIFRFARTTLNINTSVTPSNHILTRMQKQGSKHRSIIFMLKKIFGKHFTVLNAFADAAANFIKLFSLHWIRDIHIQTCLCDSLFLLLFFCLFLCLNGLLVCLFDGLCGYHIIITSVSSVFVSMYLHLCVFLWVGILYYNFTIISDFFISCYFCI